MSNKNLKPDKKDIFNNELMFSFDENIYEDTDYFFCIKCGDMVDHPIEPSICDFWFVDGQFVCVVCQRKDYITEIDKEIQEVTKMLKEKGRI